MPDLRKMLVNPLFCIALATALPACHRTPDESRVRQAIEKAEQAAEHASASSLADVLSDDFSGNDGTTERKELLGMLRAASLRGETIHALTGPVEIERRGDRFLARFTVTVTSGGKMLPANIGVYRVDTAWRKDGGEWRCYAATWVSAD